MKVSTDSVLLPAWADISTKTQTARLLDAGCGTGVISLIMAQRLDASGVQFRISAIDIDKHSCEECFYNFSISPWCKNLEVIHSSIQDYSKSGCNHSKFDFILSNPPFFTDSLKAPKMQRSNARHNHLLPLDDIIESAELLLKMGGMLSVILPEKEANVLVGMVDKHSLFSIVRVCKVKTLISKPAKRWLVEVQKEGTSTLEGKSRVCHMEELVIQKEGGDIYTREYVDLVGDYYTKEFKIN